MISGIGLLGLDREESKSNRYAFQEKLCYQTVMWKSLAFHILSILIHTMFLSEDCFARVCSNVDDFSNRNLFLTAKLLKQGYRYHKIRKAFSKFYQRHSELIVKYNIGLKLFCSKAYQNLYFMVI